MQVARDPTTGASKGYGFVSYTDFEASDAAVEAMNNQFLMNKAITVQYAFKKDGKGERHGDEAERMLAKQAKAHGVAPAVQPLPAHLFQAPTPMVQPGGPPMGGMPDHRMGMGGTPNGPGGYGRPPPMAAGAPPVLAPPPAGLPARPPSGAPASYYPAPPGFPGGPSPGAPPGFAPPGFGPR